MLQDIRLLRSRLETRSLSVSAANLPVTASAALYLTAQEARWLDSSHFAVGRWDGSVTVYQYDPALQPALRIANAIAEQDSGGVRMIANLSEGRCATSNGPGCINVWHQADPNATIVHLTYEGRLASATSGTSVTLSGQEYLVAGHDSGFLTVWQVDGAQIALRNAIDLRAKSTANPWGLQTIYAVESLEGTGNIVTAADSGDLCIVDPISSHIISTTRYDLAAKRGLNDLATFEDFVLTVNCAVGQTQPNLWLFKVNSGSLSLLDSATLRENAALPQVFAFCVKVCRDAAGPVFFVATEEGLLWIGRVEDEKLNVLGNVNVASHYGAALAVQDTRLVVAGDALHIYNVL